MKGSQVVAFDTLRSIAFGSITNSYQTLGSAFTHPVRVAKIVNNTDGDMFISDDGTNNKDFIPAGGTVVYDWTTNREGDGNVFVYGVGTQLYIKYSTVPTKGAVYAIEVYGRGQ